jgi:protein-histidine N-methyltransferase
MTTRDSQSPGTGHFLSLVVADYNPTVLQLVTLPNFILAWALQHRDTNPALRDAFSLEGELELTPHVIAAFQSYLIAANITLSFVSGGWSAAFVDLLYRLDRQPNIEGSSAGTLLLGAETIYSPFALQAFTDTVFAIFGREERDLAVALVAAKRMYFGVGGSLDDFIEKARALGATVAQLREEAEGVRRGVVRCELKPSSEVEMRM